jgi:hypothetical protein
VRWSRVHGGAFCLGFLVSALFWSTTFLRCCSFPADRMADGDAACDDRPRDRDRDRDVDFLRGIVDDVGLFALGVGGGGYRTSFFHPFEFFFDLTTCSRPPVRPPGRAPAASAQPGQAQACRRASRSPRRRDRPGRRAQGRRGPARPIPRAAAARPARLACPSRRVGGTRTPAGQPPPQQRNRAGRRHMGRRRRSCSRAVTR